MLKVITSNHACVLCQQNSSQLVCTYCCGDIQFFDLNNCHHDLRNLPHVQKGLTRTLATMNYKRLVAMAEYDWPLSGLVSALKFSRKTHCSAALAKLFVEHAMPEDLPEAIIPMPLHWWRWFRREYNQTEELAVQIGKLSQIKIRADILTRSKATRAQTQLGLKARKRNLQNAFSAQRLDGIQRVALLDDVITTGATMQVALHGLQQANPNLQIELWAMCITPLR